MAKYRISEKGEILAFRRKLLKWGQKNIRSYPWRDTDDPYKVLVAELMLRRTKAEQVFPVYLKFIEKYPTIQYFRHARKATLKKILKSLGLNWRINGFVELALVFSRCGLTTLPAQEEKLKELPGVGNYVAAAVCCLAFNAPCVLVDSNIVRVLSRYFGLNFCGEIRRNKQFIEIAENCLNHNNPKLYTLALLDLAATICTSAFPKHADCPLNACCIYFNTKVLGKKNTGPYFKNERKRRYF